MALLDHFRPPLSTHRHWHGFHNAWATYISSELNRQLPEGYYAEPNVQFGIEGDLAAVIDLVEVQVFSQEAGPTLTGAIELVSPANKDRAAHRDAFVSKCAAYLQQGIGLVIVDIVTDREANLHEELLKRLRSPGKIPLDSDLYAVAYHPVHRSGQTNLDTWQEPLALGHPLPTMPLYLRGNLCTPVNLDASYDRTCREQRVAV